MAQTPPDASTSWFSCLIEPREIVRLGSPTTGILEEVLAGRGARVSKGEVVARLRSEVEEATLNLSRARADNELLIEAGHERAGLLERQLERAERLSQGNVVSRTALDEVEVELRLARINIREAEFERHIAGLELGRAQEVLNQRVLRSPVDGVVVEKILSPGEYVHDQSEVMTIAQIDPLNVEVFVPIGEYTRIQPGMAAEVVPEAPIGGSYRAEVEVIDRVFDAASGTFGVRLILDNPDGALPAGLHCRVRFDQG